jgi:hypothetical protein
MEREMPAYSDVVYLVVMWARGMHPFFTCESTMRMRVKPSNLSLSE